MKKMYVKNFQTIMEEKWWQSLLLGLLFIALGILLLAWPGLTSTLFVMIIGVVALIFGVYRMFQALFYKEEKATQPKSMLITEAIVGMAIGLFSFFFPGVLEVAIVIIIAVWMLYYGFFDFWAGFTIPKGKVTNAFKWILVLNGLLSIVVGIFLLVNPLAGLLAMLWIIAAYAIAFGALNVVLAFLHPNRK